MSDDPKQRPGSTKPQLTTAEIMDRVHAEVVRRRAQQAAILAEADTPRSLPRWQPAEPRIESKSEYRLAELLRFDDADFVETSYQALLHRIPDPAGRSYYLSMLRDGRIGKVEVLGSIRFSEEGRKYGVHVDGLLLPYKLHQWRRKRIVGPLLGFAMGIFRLPRLALRLQSMEASAARESAELGDLLNRCEAVIDRHFADVDGAINDLRVKLMQSTAARVDAIQTVDARIGSLQQSHDANFGSLTEELHAVQAAQEQRDGEIVGRLQQHESSATSLKEELQATAQALARSDEGWKGAQVVQEQRLQEAANRLGVHDTAIAELHGQADRDQRSLRALLDRLAVFLDDAARRQRGEPSDESPLETQHASFEDAFEDAFRGARGEIKQRVAHYLGTLKDADIEPGDGLVLDLGSGRGEWLEVLTEQGYACRGVDLNRGMLKESRQRGYDVIETDAIGYLRILDGDSVAAITSMHLVEHLPHPVLVNLLDEALRVLRPGGLLILETPNPENVRVGSCDFYLDPTHLHPIPPLLLQWVVGSRGFTGLAIERLSEHRGEPDLTPVARKVPGAKEINQMIEWFTAPPDYAVIARKPNVV